MAIVSCPNCHTKVMPTADGTCPGCRSEIAGSRGAGATSTTPASPAHDRAADPLAAFREPNVAADPEPPFPHLDGSGSNPYTAPAAKRNSPGHRYDRSRHAGLAWLLFSFEGRIPRWKFWATLPALNICGIIMVVVINMMFEQTDPLRYAVMIVAHVPFAWIAFAIYAKRLHDRNMSGWWILMSAVPCLGPVWFLVVLGIMPGTIGENNYGPDPIPPLR